MDPSINKLLTAGIKKRVTQQALRQMCHGPDGKLNRNARYVAAVLNRFCDGDGRNAFPRVPSRPGEPPGPLDQTAMVRMAARREVFDFLAGLLAVTIEERRNLDED